MAAPKGSSSAQRPMSHFDRVQSDSDPMWNSDLTGLSGGLPDDPSESGAPVIDTKPYKNLTGGR